MSANPPSFAVSASEMCPVSSSAGTNESILSRAGLAYLLPFGTSLIYLLFPTKNYYWDGISFATTIEASRGLSPTLIHPHHPLYSVFGYVLYSLGPGILYRRYLHENSVRYTGFDSNAPFIKQIIKAGGCGEVCDLSAMKPLPSSDYVIMQASLYHFLPDAVPIFQRMISAARRAVIISEPIRNLADSRVPLVRTLSGRLANAGKRNEALRFNENSLDLLFETLRYPPTRTFLISGGREKVYLFQTE